MAPNGNLLLVEDEALIAMSFEIALSMHGYSCRVVPTGEQALQAVAQQVPDMVIMDVHLAGPIDGFECADRLRKIHNCPIIFVTGYNSQEVQFRGKHLNHTYYLEKPMSVQELLKTLQLAQSNFAQNSINIQKPSSQS